MAPAYAPAPERSAIFRPLSTPSLFSALSSPSASRPAPPPPPPPSAAAAAASNAASRHAPAPHRAAPSPVAAAQPRARTRYLIDAAPHTRTDLGDDDSFSPDIVSGYHFAVPLARESPGAAPPAAGPSEYEELDPFLVPSAADLAAPAPASPVHAAEREHDHRTDAVYDDLDDIGDWVANTAGPNAGADLTKKFARAISRSSALSGPTGPHAQSVAAANAALSVHQRTEDKRRENNARDKLHRATVEQVLDPRTRMILFRLLSRNRLRTLDGCVSTGKEANVYFATAASDPAATPRPDGSLPPNNGLLAHDYSPDAAVAVKVFKTSVLQFKDRERYVAGEFRFRRGGYQRGSNRKMVQQWAEKEFRNQIRLQEAGIPAPIPLLLKPPVLIMSFFGKDGWPAPRLKDAALSPSRLAKCYFRVCFLMRKMFRAAGLVHGDLSEYNMLYWKGEVIIIDVSQSVEDDHPMALDFLRRDCANVNDFFRRTSNGPILSVRELFDFVTGEHIGEGQEEQEKVLKSVIAAAAARDAADTKRALEDDEVFMRSYIPRTLQEVEVQDHLHGKPVEDLEQNLFAKLTGLTLTQKRERASSRPSKSPSVSEGSQAGASGGLHTAATAAAGDDDSRQDPYSFAVDGGCEKGDVMPNLEIPLVEPATVRTLPAPDKLRMRSSSPCTSNSSSRPNGEELDNRRYSRILEEKSNQDAAFGAGSSFGQQAVDATSETQLDDDQYFEDNGESDSSSGDGWVRKSREEAADPYMGMTKKEWKKRVKAEAREKRENKVPKHVKKRKETLAKRRRGNK